MFYTPRIQYTRNQSAIAARAMIRKPQAPVKKESK